MKYKDNWDETKERFSLWWQGKNTGRPLMRVVARRKEPLEGLIEEREPKTPEEFWCDVENNVNKYRNYCNTHKFLAEAFPALRTDLGPGSMALYLGSEPGFAWDTVWYKECISDWKEWDSFKYDPNNKWWQRHLDMIKNAQYLADGDFLVNIPDIIENLDILSAMRGPQNFIFDIMDEPEKIKEYIKQVDSCYYKFYDAMYDVVKDKDGGSCYTCFEIWGPGKTGKIQCDFSALISPSQFREFFIPSLKEQCQYLDYSLYHLDGPEAVKHLDALMKIDELNALQWVPSPGQPDGGNEKWYSIYDRVRDAGKSIWIFIHNGGIDDWWEKADKCVKRYGTGGLYFLFPEMDEPDAVQFIQRADREWK